VHWNLLVVDLVTWSWRALGILGITVSSGRKGLLPNERPKLLTEVLDDVGVLRTFVRYRECFWQRKI